MHIRDKWDAESGRSAGLERGLGRRDGNFARAGRRGGGGARPPPLFSLAAEWNIPNDDAVPSIIQTQTFREIRKLEYWSMTLFSLLCIIDAYIINSSDCTPMGAKVCRGMVHELHRRAGGAGGEPEASGEE